MTPSATDIFDACHIFRAVRDPGRRRLTDLALLRRFEAGEIIFRQGQSCPGVYIVGNGLVRIYNVASSGREHVLHLVGPGGTFAEVAAIGGFDCPAFAQAIEQCTCALLPTEPFVRALREDHALCLQLLTGMSLWVKQLVDLVEDITLRDAIGRVARYLLTLAGAQGDELRLPSLKKHLASHLNISSETLSRTLRRLMELGLIESNDDQALGIFDRAKLGAVAQGM